MDSTAEPLKVLMDRRLVSPAALARHLGVSRSAVWNWLRNENGVSIDMKRRICEYFGFVDDEGFPQPEKVVWPREE